MEFQKSEYFQKRAHKFYPSISRGSRLLKSTQSSLSRDFCCLSISLLPRCLRLAPYLHFHLSFSSFIGRPPESHLKGFSLLVCVLQKVSRLCLLKSRDSCYLSILYGLAVFVRRHISTFISRPPESLPTTPPEISRFPFGTKVIKILDLSLYLQPTRPFTVSSTLSYSPKPVLHQPRHQTESAPLVHQSPCTFILISPCLTTTLISPVHHFRQLPSSLSRQFTLHCYPSYSPKPVLHQPRHQTESAPLVHQSPCTFYPHLTLSYNNTHQSSSSLPTITKFAFPTVHHALFSFLFPKASPSPTTPPDRIRSSRSSISLHVLSSSHPVLQQHSSVQFITSYNYQVRFPDNSP